MRQTRGREDGERYLCRRDRVEQGKESKAKARSWIWGVIEAKRERREERELCECAAEAKILYLSSAVGHSNWPSIGKCLPNARQ